LGGVPISVAITITITIVLPRIPVFPTQIPYRHTNLVVIVEPVPIAIRIAFERCFRVQQGKPLVSHYFPLLLLEPRMLSQYVLKAKSQNGILSNQAKIHLVKKK
jgi:hypothetical protein